MSASIPASVAMDQARELTALRHELTLCRALIRQAEIAAGDYLKAPHDDLVGAIKDMRQEILLVRTALNRAAEDVERQRSLVTRIRAARCTPPCPFDRQLDAILEEERFAAALAAGKAPGND